MWLRWHLKWEDQIFEEQLTSADRIHYEGLRRDLILPEVFLQCLSKWYHILYLQTQVAIDSYGPRRWDLRIQTITTGQQFKGISWRNILWIFLANMKFHKDSLEVIPKVEEWVTMCLIKKVSPYLEIILQHDSTFMSALDQVITQIMEHSNAHRPVPATEEIIEKLPREVLMEGCKQPVPLRHLFSIQPCHSEDARTRLCCL